MIKNPSEKDEIYLSNVKKIGNSAENVKYMKNILSKEDHEILLNYVKTRKVWTLEPWDAETVAWDQMPEEILNILEKIFTIVYKNIKDFYDVEINKFGKESLTLIKLKNLALDPHVDTDSAESNHIASIYYINDDYKGGEIDFPDLNIDIKPKPNSLIFFPGNENYVHRVRKIVNGERFSSSMWFQFSGSTFTKNAEWYSE